MLLLADAAITEVMAIMVATATRGAATIMEAVRTGGAAVTTGIDAFACSFLFGKGLMR